MDRIDRRGAEYLELKVSQKEKDEREEKEKEAKQKRRKHWEESKQKGSGGKGAAKKAVRLALDAKTLRCALYLFSLTLDLIPGQASMARGQVRRGGKPLKGQNFVVSDSEEGLVKLDEGCLYRTDDMGEAMVPISLREGVNHPVKLSKDDLLMDVELIDEGAFCALKDMKTNSREYAVMRSNVTQEERDFMTEYHKQSEPQGEAHWSEGLGICNPGDYELDSYKQEPKSARTMKKVEDNMGFEETSLPDKHDCTLADLYSGHYNVCSISKETLSRPDVAIMVVLCCGPGGVSHGTVRKMGNTHLITALAIDCDPLSCATHELSHPHIPVVKYEMGEWEDTLALIHRYVPKVLMSKTYIHVSNSCRQASTGNITFRDLSQAQRDTDWYLALLAKTRCVAWTLENVPSLLRKYEGVYPTSRVFAMNAFCAMGQSRKRMILSNIALDIPKYSGKVVTARDVLGEMKGWKQHEKYWQRNSYGDARSVDTPSFTVTGGAHHIGAPTLGEMYSEHIPGWRERAMLQSLKPEAVRFPANTTETQKRQLVASVVPPLFAACLSKAVFPHLSMGVQKHNMRSMMTSLAVRSEEEIDSAFFSKGGSGREGRENRTVRLTTKESASSSKWLENEGISSYAEAAVMFEGATGAVEKENELLRKQ